MTLEEMREYLLSELETERKRMLENRPNNYGYLFLLVNDMGLIAKD